MVYELQTKHRFTDMGKGELSKMHSQTEAKYSGPEVIKLFSCLTQLSMKFYLLINVKMPTIVGILTFMSR